MTFKDNSQMGNVLVNLGAAELASMERMTADRIANMIAQKYVADHYAELAADKDFQASVKRLAADRTATVVAETVGELLQPVPVETKFVMDPGDHFGGEVK